MKRQNNKKNNKKRPQRGPSKSNGRLITIDGQRGDSLLSIRPNARHSYVDTDINATTISTTVSRTSLFTAISAMLVFTPALCKIVLQGSSNTPKYFCRIRITGVDVNLNFVGSEGNPLVSGDTFNRLRFILYDTDFPFSATVVPSWDIDSLSDFTIVRTSLLDHVSSLSAPAYDPTDVNVIPATQNVMAHIPMNRVIEFVSTTTAAGLPTVFDTREGNIGFAMVSDSAVAPSPSISGAVRLHFIRLDQ